ncbi:MAG: polyisoprenoid-binding protein YceI [Roseivirga sp.]|jgi:polyisoprenoid-binding protein YceI
MKKILLSLMALGTLSLMAFTNIEDKYVSRKSQIKFYSTTPLEDIEANNYKTVSTLDTSTGDVVFSVPMQSFEFEKALMQEHFNGKNFLSTKKYPKAKLIGKITNLGEVDFTKDGTYNGNFSGEMTIRGETQSIISDGKITVSGETFNLESTIDLTLADYGIAFKKGKPSTNIAKTIKVTLIAEYAKQ